MSSAKTYSTVHSWWQHEVQRHRILRSWKCSPCEQANRQSQFETSASFDAHIIEHHVKLTRTPIQNIRDVCQRETGVQDPRTQCPLCKETILCKENGQAQKTKRTVRKHVSNHLEQLAFFVAIPAGQMVVDDDESEFQDDSDSEGGLKTEIESIVSFDTHMSKKHLQSANVQRFMANQEKTNDGHARTPSWSKSAAGHDEATTAQDGSIGSKALFEPPAVPPAFPMRLLMHPPNEHFYARQNLLADADTVLRSSGSICLFYGVGGVGKTLAAVQYIYTHQDQFDAIFWLQADTAPRLSDSYLQMAMALGLSSGTEDHNHALEKGRNWLQGTGTCSIPAVDCLTDANR